MNATISSTRHRAVLLLAAVLMLMLSACRTDDDIVMPTTTDTGLSLSSSYAGLYVLCEGNMGPTKPRSTIWTSLPGSIRRTSSLRAIPLR